MSRLLFGSKADQPVIYVTTRRGEAYKKVLKVKAEGGVMDPISYPKFLGAADYMSLYNEALVNDGKIPAYESRRLRTPEMQSIQCSIPMKVITTPPTYAILKLFTVFAEGSGGNDIAQYFVYMGWNRENSLLALGKEGKHDLINLSGNANYKINNYITMRADGVAIFDLNTNLKNGDFWQNSSSFLPNQAPVLIPVSDSGLLATASLVDGNHILGGSSIYQDNIYGDMVVAGYRNTVNRILQINTGFDIDLNFITEGLTAKAYLTFDVRNYYETRLMNLYEVYNPVVMTDAGGGDSIAYQKIGQWDREGSESLLNPNFYRRIGMYGTLNYHRIFNSDHEVNAIAVAYRQQLQ